MRGLRFIGCIYSNPFYEVERREYYRMEAIEIKRLLEDDEEMPTYELDGLSAAIINENKIIWLNDALFLLEKDTSFDRGTYPWGDSKPLYYSEIEIVP